PQCRVHQDPQALRAGDHRVGMPDVQGEELIVLGVIAGAHGISGEVRVLAYNPESANLEQAENLTVRDAKGGLRGYRVTRARRHKKYFLFKLEGIEDRNAAEAARGGEIVIPRAKL